MSVKDIMQDIDTLLQHYRNPGLRDSLLRRIEERCHQLSEPALPKEPPPALIESMCFRYAHDFGLNKDPDAPLSGGWTDEGREALRQTMRQLYEEVAGHGFYRWNKS